MSAVRRAEAALYVGLMSGTSLDGIDAVVARFSPEHPVELLQSHYLPFPDSLRSALLALHAPQANEIHLAACAGNTLAGLYAEAVESVLVGCTRDEVAAIGCHGQTLRHCPADGYTLQIGNAALLAERTGLTVVTDFRSRDIAAGGQGAPLVPAFHAEVLAAPDTHRVIANIGGIANLTDLPPAGPVRGWDTGPGNMLLDAWIARHNGARFDRDGAWGASGVVMPGLLNALLAHPYFAEPAPKSAGREQFNLNGLDEILSRLGLDDAAPADVQATLAALTAQTLGEAVRRNCAGAQAVYVCGGGAHNAALMQALAAQLPGIQVDTTQALGVAPDWVEALAFAWLARQNLMGLPGNLPAVTGARGPRILGAIYPAS